MCRLFVVSETQQSHDLWHHQDCNKRRNEKKADSKWSQLHIFQEQFEDFYGCSKWNQRGCNTAFYLFSLQ